MAYISLEKFQEVIGNLNSTEDPMQTPRGVGVWIDGHFDKFCLPKFIFPYNRLTAQLMLEVPNDA